MKKKLLTHFLARNFPYKLIQNTLIEVPYSRRQQLLTTQDKEKNDQPPPFITTYTKQITSKDLHTALDPTDENIQTPRITYRRGKTIANHIVRAKLPNTTDPPILSDEIRIHYRPTFTTSSAPCNISLCKCCAHMSKKHAIYDHQHRRHKLPINTDCNSTNVIYLLECTLCQTKNRYIGQTSRPMKHRLNGHRTACMLLANQNRPLYKHLTKANHALKHLSITILERLPDDTLLLQREDHWITTLQTRYPNGLNSLFSN